MLKKLKNRLEASISADTLKAKMEEINVYNTVAYNVIEKCAFLLNLSISSEIL